VRRKLGSGTLEVREKSLGEKKRAYMLESHTSQFPGRFGLCLERGKQVGDVLGG